MELLQIFFIAIREHLHVYILSTKNGKGNLLFDDNVFVWEQ